MKISIRVKFIIQYPCIIKKDKGCISKKIVYQWKKVKSCIHEMREEWRVAQKPTKRNYILNCMENSGKTLFNYFHTV